MNSDIAAQGGDEAEIERVGSQVTARSRASMSAADPDPDVFVGRCHRTRARARILVRAFVLCVSVSACKRACVQVCVPALGTISNE